jgi:hypothetical protein
MFSRRIASGPIIITLSMLVVMTAGCTSPPKHVAAPVPQVTPPTPQAAVPVPQVAPPTPQAAAPTPQAVVLVPQAEVPIPVVPLAETPPAVRAVVLTLARGRPIEKITRVGRLEGQLYRAYIADKLGPELLAVDDGGKIVDDAVVIPFAEMPEAVRNSAQSGVAGKLQICRVSIHRPQPMYMIDYLIENDEPVFALIDADGVVQAVFGYAEGDPD